MTDIYSSVKEQLINNYTKALLSKELPLESRMIVNFQGRLAGHTTALVKLIEDRNLRRYCYSDIILFFPNVHMMNLFREKLMPHSLTSVEMHTFYVKEEHFVGRMSPDLVVFVDLLLTNTSVYNMLEQVRKSRLDPKTVLVIG